MLERISQMQRKLEIFKSKVPQLKIVYFPYITQKLEGGLKHAVPKYQEDTVDIRKDIQDILFIEGLEIVSSNAENSDNNTERVNPLLGRA